MNYLKYSFILTIGILFTNYSPFLSLAFADEDININIYSSSSEPNGSGSLIWVLQTLRDMEEDALPSVPYILSLMTEQPDIIIPALEALYYIKPNIDELYPKLELYLKYEDPAVRARTLYTLGNLSSEGKYLDIFIDGMHDVNRDVRIAALWSLKNNVKLSEKALPHYMELLYDPDIRVKTEAASYLYEWGNLLEPYRDEIIKGINLKSNGSTYRIGMVKALYCLDPDEKTKAALLNIPDDLNEDIDIRKAAILALINQNYSIEISNIMRKAICDPNEGIRETGAAAIGKIGNKAKNLIPDLILALDDKDTTVQREALKALALLDANNNFLRCYLRSILKLDITVPASNCSCLTQFDDRFIITAAYAYVKLYSDSKRAEAILLEGVDNDGMVKADTATYLSMLPYKPIYIYLLMKLLDDDSFGIRKIAAESLSKFGVKAKPALGKLQDLADDKLCPSFMYPLFGRDYRAAAREAIDNIVSETE